jgi:ribosomal protein L37AE/L43A
MGLVTSDKSLIFRYGKQSHPDPRTNQASTPQPCPVCGKDMYPQRFGNKISYLHKCSARLKSGKSISKHSKY